MKLPDPKLGVMLFMLLLMASCTVMIQPPVECSSHDSGDVVVDKVFRDCPKKFNDSAVFGQKRHI